GNGKHSEGVRDCWRRDSNPHGAFAPPDFLTTMAFATLAVRSLDFLLAVDVRVRPQPQSLYTFFFLPLGRCQDIRVSASWGKLPACCPEAHQKEAWLGIATTQTC